MGLIKSYRLAHTESLETAFQPSGAPARWNSKGTVIVYTSEHLALAALEILNYWEVYPALDGYSRYSSQFNERLCEHLELKDLDLNDEAQTREIGDEWIANGSSLALRVPSVALPGYNYLLNPNHPDWRTVKTAALGLFEFDERVNRMIELGKEAIDKRMAETAKLAEATATPAVPSTDSKRKSRKKSAPA